MESIKVTRQRKTKREREESLSFSFLSFFCLCLYFKQISFVVSITFFVMMNVNNCIFFSFVAIFASGLNDYVPFVTNKRSLLSTQDKMIQQEE